jgi:formamidopyrimidine-DNA glycosylase
LSGRYIKKPIPNLQTIPDKTINSIECKGKFIWFDLGDIVIFNTLGMTGNWSRIKTKHSRISISFYENDIVYFNDIRNFGTFQIKSKQELLNKLKTLGPDMLSSPCTKNEFIRLLRKKNNKNICDVIMNQSVISGVGNYIKAESLWYSRIYPHCLIKDLTDKNLETLWAAIKFVINKSYDSNGASIKDFYSFEGEGGNAVQGFAVYGRKKDFNGNTVLKEKTSDKRTTHWVKERQIYGIT